MLDNLEILMPLNDYLLCKTAIILRCVSKNCKYIIKPRKFYSLLKQLNFSDLNMIKMFVDSGKHLVFNDIMKSLRLFKNNITKFYRWNNIHWSLLLTFLIYRDKHYHERFINSELKLKLIEVGFNLNIKVIYKTVKEVPLKKIRELILI